MIPKTLSASSLQVAALCLDRWCSEYIDRAPNLSNPAGDVGTTVHSALEQFVKAIYIDKTHIDLDKTKQKELLVTFYQMSYVQTFNTADFDTPEFNDGFDLCIAWFRRTHLDRIFKIESCELKETIKIPYNHPDGTLHEIDFNYIMDRVDQLSDTEWEVVDYKTIRVPIQPDDLDTKIQARAYALAIQIKHPECTKVKITFDLLRHEPVSMFFSRDDNIAFWRFLCNETQRIVDTPRESVQPTLNPECGYCVKKYTCPLLQKNINAGGYHNLDIHEKAKLAANLQVQVKANTRIIDELEEALMRHAAETDSLEWETDDGSTTVEIGMTAGRRGFDARQAAEIMGPELFATMGNMTLGNLEKIIKDESLDPEMRASLKTLISKGNGNLKVFIKPKKKVI